MNTENDNNDEMSVEELRRQIKGNLLIAADTWPITQLAALEQKANALALSGIYAEGMLYSGLVELDKLVYDEKGKIKLSSDPDDDSNIYRVLAKMVADNDARFAEIAEKCVCDDSGSCKAHGVQVEAKKPEDDYTKFF